MSPPKRRPRGGDILSGYPRYSLANNECYGGQNVMNRDFSEIGNLIIFNIFKNVMGLAFFWWLGSENFRDICSILRPTHTH